VQQPGELLHSVSRTVTLTCIEDGHIWSIGKRVFDMKLKLVAAPKRELLDFLRKVI
jgi:hypothetical protein